MKAYSIQKNACKNELLSAILIGMIALCETDNLYNYLHYYAC